MITDAELDQIIAADNIAAFFNRTRELAVELKALRVGMGTDEDALRALCADAAAFFARTPPVTHDSPAHERMVQRLRDAGLGHDA